MDYKLLAEQNKLYLEAWYLFYQSFTENDTHISNARSIVVEMFSELIQVKRKNPEHSKIVKSEERLNNLLSIIDKFEGLNNRCINLQQILREKNANEFRLMDKIEKIEMELRAVKEAHQQID